MFSGTPYWEWNELQAEDKRQYLQSKLMIDGYVAKEMNH
jgi:hypothetical protein